MEREEAGETRMKARARKERAREQREAEKGERNRVTLRI